MAKGASRASAAADDFERRRLQDESALIGREDAARRGEADDDGVVGAFDDPALADRPYQSRAGRRGLLARQPFDVAARRKRRQPKGDGVGAAGVRQQRQEQTPVAALRQVALRGERQDEFGAIGGGQSDESMLRRHINDNDARAPARGADDVDERGRVRKALVPRRDDREFRPDRRAFGAIKPADGQPAPPVPVIVELLSPH